MKRILGLMAVMAMAIAIAVPLTAAAAPGNGNGAGNRYGTNAKSYPAAEYRVGFVDADGDGVCDNYELRLDAVDQQDGKAVQNVKRSYGYIDADGDGICDNFDNRMEWQGRGGWVLGRNARAIGTCLGYVDADNDGICDNYEQRHGATGVRDGSGATWGAGRGRGYVDADGDGICDNRQ